jgi:ATP-binding cassette subfamily C protein RsaD
MFRANPEEPERMPLPAPTGKVSVEMAAFVPPGGREPTMRGASFQIEAGTAVGVVGPSAAGKSTLLRGLVGVWPTVQGVVRLDGFDIQQWDAQQLGAYIGYLPQDIELFSGTVAENIARFGEFSSEDVIAAAQMAGVHGMIQELPKGYDTQIGDGGAVLSGGQRQRLALARAIYRTPSLVVLDEPNASLDAAGEAALAEALLRLKQAKKTVVFATHKPNLLNCADKIMVVTNGMVAQLGDREPMMAQLLGLKPAPTPTPAQAAGAPARAAG